MKNMKLIGLLGGMSWESTVEYYKIMNTEVQKRLGGHNSAEVLIYSLNFEEIKDLHFKQDWEGVAKMLIDRAVLLEQAGAKAIVICTNTMHLVADKIKEKISIPIIHIVHETGKKAKEANIKKIGLLGTKDTMEKPLYKDIFENSYNIDMITPPEDERIRINDIIYNELVFGKIEQSSKEQYLEIIRKLIEQGAEGIILGCTEIPLLIKQEDLTVPIFDTTMIHAMASVDFMLKYN